MVENVPPGKTWEALKTNPNAQLVDVRTDAEWNFVGVPDLAAAGKQAVLLPWQVYPAMQRNAAVRGAVGEGRLHPGASHLLSVPQRRAQPRRRRGGPGRRDFPTSTTSPTGSRGRRTGPAIAA